VADGAAGRLIGPVAAVAPTGSGRDRARSAPMNETARVALTVVCYAVAAIAQLTALALLVREGRRSSGVLRRWSEADPGQRAELSGLVGDLVGSSFDRGAAVALLFVGVATGALGHFLSL
jgi:hypothetical protein